MSLSIGIVGLPNVGKSTLFNALTKASALASTYAFATVEPNVGVVGIPDPRLTVLAEMNSERHALTRSLLGVGTDRQDSAGPGPARHPLPRPVHRGPPVGPGST